MHYFNALAHFGICLIVSLISTFSHNAHMPGLAILHPALHMGVWVAAAYLLLPLLLLPIQLLLRLLPDINLKDPLKFSSHLCLKEKHSLKMYLLLCLAR